MSYAAPLGQFSVKLSSPTLDVSSVSATPAPNPEAWRAPIVEAATRYLVAVAAARRKMPGWGDREVVYRTAQDWLNASRNDTLPRLQFRAGLWAPIVATSMPTTRYGAIAERDAVMAGQAALKAAVLPPVAPPPQLIRIVVPALTTKVPVATKTSSSPLPVYGRGTPEYIAACAASPGTTIHPQTGECVLAPTATPYAPAAPEPTAVTDAPPTWDTSAMPPTPEATMTVAVATTGLGPLGISWKIWGVGAAALVGGYFLLNSRAMKANKRRARRNRRHR
jgi:hypothetical protein